MGWDRGRKMAIASILISLGTLLTAGFAARSGLMEEWHLQGLHSRDASRVHGSLVWLGRKGSARALLPLLRWRPAPGAVEDPGPALQEIAARGTEAAQALVEALGDPDLAVRYRAFRLLETVGEPAVPPLLDALRRPDPDFRAHAAWALGKLAHGHGEAARGLELALHDSDASVREESRVALGRIRAGRRT